MSEHEVFIRKAIELAKNSRVNGNHPFGALLVHDHDVILTAENTVVSGNNPTHHAETNLINMAWKSLPADVIKASVLYTSCEPCPMCTGAIFWSGVRTVVFSLPATVLGEIANDKFCQSCCELFDRADDKTTVIGPILQEEGELVHQDFWENL
jgi:tRNA(Arg) A34 adenosine deaminase TadA